jgi:phosphoserine phosphatase RsbX
MVVDSAILDWSIASRPLAGETDSGDQAVVEVLPNGALVAAVDGLGHGVHAAHAASRAIELVRDDPDEPPVALVNRCHEALRNTRGVAMSLARFSVPDHTVTWLGVGNIEGKLVRGADAQGLGETLVTFRGAAGVQLQTLRARTVGIRRGDALVLATDGIDPRFADALEPGGSAEEMADGILRDYARTNDDALVVVARYLGADS